MRAMSKCSEAQVPQQTWKVHVWNSLSGFRPMRSYEEAVAVASLVTAVGITSRSALLEMAEAEDRPDAASFGQLSRHDEQALLLRAR